MARRNLGTNEAEQLAKALKYLPGGVMGRVRRNEETAFVVKNGRGSKLYDVSGNEYVDWLLGSGPMILGHAHPAVVGAVREYAERGSTYFQLNEPAIALAEEICKAVPCAEMLRFGSSGSEATYIALRLARTHTGKDKILKFEGGYHGSHDYSIMSSTPAKLYDFPKPCPDSKGIPKAIEDQVLIAPFNDLATTARLLEKHHNELAAVIVEPVQRLLCPEPGFLQGLRDLTTKYKVLLVFDEIVTGFRLAWGGAQEVYGVVPDLAAYGKIPGGGYPLSAVVGRADLISPMNPSLMASGEYVDQGGTLNGNPIGAAAGLATLGVLKQEGAYKKIHATGRALRDGMTAIINELGVPAQILGTDPMFDIVFMSESPKTYRDELAQNKARLLRFNTELLKRGILKGTYKIYVSLAHTAEDVDKTLSVVREVLPLVMKD